jgi:NAD(P)-dependent dehydrogenase (short-subunit alcohol dehydrogenase family)
VDALVNTQGGVTARKFVNSDGVESTFAGNFLHPLLLACSLLPELEAAGGRIVQMSTGYHHLVRLKRADLEGRRWDCGMNVYGRAKLLSVQAGEVVGRLWAARGVGWHFADPGMAETPLTRSMGAETFPWYGRFLMPVVKRVQRPIPLSWCASSTLRLLIRKDLPAPSGVYVLPGPLVLPRPLVGFNLKAGRAGLDYSYRWLRPEYRAMVEKVTRSCSVASGPVSP